MRSMRSSCSMTCSCPGKTSSAIATSCSAAISGGARRRIPMSIIMLPSSVRDFEAPAVAADLERYIASPGYPSRARVAALKLAWDLIGTEFAGRHEQYEKFYGGSSFLVKQNMARAYDFAAAARMVERALQLPAES